MGKSKSKTTDGGVNVSVTVKADEASRPHFDPDLAALFASSLGPIKLVPSSATATAAPKRAISPHAAPLQEDDDVAASSMEDDQIVDRNTARPEPVGLKVTPKTSEGRKRKRQIAEEDIEGKYMNRLAQEEAKEKALADGKKRQKLSPEDDDENLSSVQSSDSESVGTGTDDRKKPAAGDIPKHESELGSKEHIELEKASRTIFLSNVSTTAIKSKSSRKILLDHLTSFLSDIPEHGINHGIESIRFRSTAFTSTGVPRKAAYAKKELMDTTTKSTHAYVVYNTQLAAREATKRLNATTVLDRHLRVDSVAHPAKQDHHRCIFVGNLGFVDDESAINAAEDEEKGQRPRKAKEPADVEEGLWRTFGKAGKVESVRVIRDKQTRVGKGFAYVQFENANTVEKALLYNEKKFPPMLPRILRVTRAKKPGKTAMENKNKDSPKFNSGSKTYKPKMPSEAKTLAGRADKLLGRAYRGGVADAGSKNVHGIDRTPESIVLEGYRASQGKAAINLGGSGRKQGKPRTRSSRRGTDYKARNRKK